MPLDVDHIPEVRAREYRRLRRESIDELRERYAALLRPREKPSPPPEPPAPTDGPWRGRPVVAEDDPSLAFESAKLASLHFGCWAGAVSHAIRNTSRVAGHYWRYTDEVTA